MLRLPSLGKFGRSILAFFVVALFAWVLSTAQPVRAQANDDVNNGTVIIGPQVTVTVTPTPVPSDPATQSMLNSLCAGANFEINSSCNTGSLTETAVQERFTRLIRSVVNIFSIVVGVVAVFMIIIGGLRYITSGGDSSNVSSAKNTILYVLVGLTVVAMSQVLVRFVITRLSSVQ